MPRRRLLLGVLPLTVFLACATGTSLESDGGGGEGGAPSTNTVGPTSTSATTGAATTGAATTGAATTGAATTATTGAVTTGGVVNCDPTNPGPGCGGAMHCVAQSSGAPTCEAAGTGTQYVGCPSGRSQCAPVFECVSTGLDSCCMGWCQVLGGSCPGTFDSCTGFDPPVFVNGVEFGACWDGFPC